MRAQNLLKFPTAFAPLNHKGKWAGTDHFRAPYIKRLYAFLMNAKRQKRQDGTARGKRFSLVDEEKRPQGVPELAVSILICELVAFGVPFKDCRRYPA